MPLAITVLAAGIFIEILGTVISVSGASAMFNGNMILIAFVLALDIGKVVTISAAYNYWSSFGRAMKVAALVAIGFTVTLSSYSAAGYLNAEFQKAMLGQREANLKASALEAQIAKYEARKQQIDTQIANVPEKTSVAARIRLINAFKAEQAQVTANIEKIEAQLPEMKVAALTKEAKAGPILALSKALDIPLETATNIVVGLLIVVFNPFAVLLILIGNLILKQRGLEVKAGAVVRRKPAVKAGPVKSAKPAAVVTAKPAAVVTAKPAATVAPAVKASVVEEVKAEEVVADAVEALVAPVVTTKTRKPRAARKAAVVQAEEVTEVADAEIVVGEVKTVERVKAVEPVSAAYVSLLQDPALDKIRDDSTLSLDAVSPVGRYQSNYQQ